MPTHWQLAFSTSFVVQGLPSLQLDPIWPATLGQLSCALQTPSPSLSGLVVPKHWQLAFSTSFVVQGLPSLQLDPIWPATFGQLSCALQTPSPSLSGLVVPKHWQLAFHVSFTVQALPSVHPVPGIAGPPVTPAQSGAGVPEATAIVPRERFWYRPLWLTWFFTARTMNSRPAMNGMAGFK